MLLMAEAMGHSPEKESGFKRKMITGVILTAQGRSVVSFSLFTQSLDVFHVYSFALLTYLIRNLLSEEDKKRGGGFPIVVVCL